MRVIFMGTPDFAVSVLAAVAEAGHEILLAVTQPDRPKGRGKQIQYSPVKEWAIEHDVPVYQPRRIRDEEAAAYLARFEADIIVVAAFGQILPKEILELPPYGCVNVHASLLPKYRGAAPIQWAVINGDPVSGVTTMQMDEGLDTGDMLLKTVIELDKKETGGSLHDKLADAGAKLCVETLRRMEEGSIRQEKQSESPTVYAKMLGKALGRIDWNRDAVSIERLIRGLNPWPSAYTTWDKKTMKIWDADVAGDVPGSEEAKPGTITSVSKQEFTVKTGEGSLTIRELQIPGKKRMDAGAFLRGYSLKEGLILGEN